MNPGGQGAFNPDNPRGLLTFPGVRQPHFTIASESDSRVDEGLNGLPEDRCSRIKSLEEELKRHRGGRKYWWSISAVLAAAEISRRLLFESVATERIAPADELVSAVAIASLGNGGEMMYQRVVAEFARIQTN